MSSDSRKLRYLQRKFWLGAAAIAPVAPLLFLQGQITRWKVGVLPDAAGATTGRVGGQGDAARLLVIGESTVAGLGARNHELALAGQFAKNLSEHLGSPIEWHVVGKNGVTARRVVDELLPLVPMKSFDYVLLGIGGNDVLGLSSPRRWRTDMLELLSRLRSRFPEAVVFVSNCPMVILSPAIPQPSRRLLWEVSRMHNDNIVEFTRDMERVFYYPQPVGVTLDGFFADGVHPSEQGYAEWAAAMVSYFAGCARW